MHGGALQEVEGSGGFGGDGPDDPVVGVAGEGQKDRGVTIRVEAFGGHDFAGFDEQRRASRFPTGWTSRASAFHITSPRSAVMSGSVRFALKRDAYRAGSTSGSRA